MRLHALLAVPRSAPRLVLPVILAGLAAGLLPACDAVVEAAAAASATASEPVPLRAAALARAVSVEEAPEWTALFDRRSGWTGADGIYSIPLAGLDAPGTAGEQPTAFVFSDTWIGEVDAAGQRQPGSRLVNNTMALLQGDAPDPDRMRFYWRGGGEPRAVFVPETPAAQQGDWYWPGDGFVDEAAGGTTYLLPARVRRTGQGAFDFEVVGVSILALPPGARPPFAEQRQTELPFFRAPGGDRGRIILNGGVFVNTAWAGAPEPDGYVYVYGVEEVPFNKYLVVARVPAGRFEDLGAWRFYDGAGWSRDARDLARLTDRVSNELSLTPLPDGGYALVFQRDAIGPVVAARAAPSPVGPFGPVVDLYRTPEPEASPAYVYNAKAHPHLSAPGTLLISYNVNAETFEAGWNDADLYHPRFIRVRF